MNKYNIDSGINLKIGDNKDILFLFLSLAISGLFLYFVAGASYKDSLVIARETELKKTNLESKKELLDNVEDFNKESKESDMDLDKLSSFIPNRNNYEDFFAHINGLAERDALGISEISMENVKGSDDEKSNSDLQGKVIYFSLTGDYMNFMHFMESIENSIPFIQEVSMSINTQKETSAPEEEGEEEIKEVNLYPTLEYSVSFKFLYY